MSRPTQQRGVAIITALIVMTLAATIAAYVAFDLQISIRRTGNILYNDQAYLYSLLAEEAVMELLIDDRNNNKTDSFKDDWAGGESGQLPPFTDGTGTVSAQINDLQGRFNLNNLVTAEGKIDPLANQRLENILRYLAQKNGAENQWLAQPGLSNAIAAWIDPRSDVQGAGDLFYLDLENPYRAANAPITSVSELRMIRGFLSMKGKTFTALSQLVSALPTHTSININTAPPGVLVGLGLDEDLAMRIAEQVKNKPYTTVSDFLREEAIVQFNTQHPTRKITAAGLSVSSDYFHMKALATASDGRYELNSLLYRGQSAKNKSKIGVSVLMRSQTPL